MRRLCTANHLVETMFTKNASSSGLRLKPGERFAASIGRWSAVFEGALG
jgi:hypothetical protein